MVLLQSVTLAGRCSYFILVAYEPIGHSGLRSKTVLWPLTWGFSLRAGCNDVLQVLNLISSKSVHLPHRDPTLDPKSYVGAPIQIFA